MRHGKGTCNALLQENKMMVNRSISTETEEETETDTDTEEEKEQIQKGKRDKRAVASAPALPYKGRLRAAPAAVFGKK